MSDLKEKKNTILRDILIATRNAQISIKAKFLSLDATYFKLTAANQTLTGNLTIVGTQYINIASTSAFKVGLTPSFQVDTVNNSVGIGTAPSSAYLLAIIGSSSNYSTGVLITPTLTNTATPIMYGVDINPSFSGVPQTGKILTGVRFQSAVAAGDGGYGIALIGGNFTAAIQSPNKSWTYGFAHTVTGGMFSANAQYFGGAPIAAKINCISGYFAEPNNLGAAGSWSVAAYMAGNSLLATGKKLYFEGNNSTGPVATNYIGGAANVLSIVAPTINLTASTAIAHGTSVITGTGTVGCGALTSTGIVTATYFKTSTAVTVNSTGTVAIVAKDANLLTNNAGWLPMKDSGGNTIYLPYWT